MQLLLMLFSIGTLMSLASGQTFQYSRGWINGKRSDPDVVALGHASGEGAAPLMDIDPVGGVVPSIESSCTTDEHSVIVLSRDRMLQLLVHAMHSLQSVKIRMCINPETKNKHLQAIF